MPPDVRRIIAVEAHRRRSGRCPVRVHSLGTGESFDIRPSDGGFVDVASGLAVTSSGEQVLVSQRPPIRLRMFGDVGFDGYDADSQEFFSGRAGGGSSVTLYDAALVDFFQYAVVADGDRT